jgi:hypothetical protein
MTGHLPATSALAKGIKGYPASALTKADGSTYGTGSNKDLSVYHTMGECVANGGSWNNWLGKPVSTTSVSTTPSPANNSTIPVWDFTKQAPETTNGCLHCHSTVTQYNGPAERFKDSYLNHGHKNMLRKVTAGKKWAGPNEHGELEYYTEAATGPINFDTATAKIGGVESLSYTSSVTGWPLRLKVLTLLLIWVYQEEEPSITAPALTIARPVTQRAGALPTIP